MGANDGRRQSRGVDQRTPHLPRYVVEHIGQVLRNRLREDLLIPVPGEMLDRLKRMGPAQRVVTAPPGSPLEGSKARPSGRSESTKDLGS